MLGDRRRRLADSPTQRRQGQKGSSSSVVALAATTSNKGNSDGNGSGKAKDGDGEKEPFHESVHDMIIDLITTFTTGKGEWEGDMLL